MAMSLIILEAASPGLDLLVGRYRSLSSYQEVNVASDFHHCICKLCMLFLMISTK